MDPQQPSRGRPLRVARLITWLPVGGIERRLAAVLPRLKARGMEPKVFCLRERGPLADQLEGDGIPVELAPMKSRLHPPSLLRLERALRAFAPDIVHCHMYRANVPGTIAARRARAPVVFAQVHNVDSWQSWRQRAMDRLLCRWRTGMIGVSQAVVDDIQRTLGVPPARTALIHNGADSEEFRPDPARRAAARRELGLGEGQVAALVPARLHSNKAPMATLDAFAQAVAQGGLDDAVLLFAGEGPLEEDLRRAVADRGLGGQARLLGKRDDMAALYDAADVVVLSTLKEGFSNAIVEALLCGKPVIAARVGGNAEAITGAEHGWLHDAGDGAALAAQLRAALSDPQGLRARESACRAQGMKFSLDAMVDATEALYLKALSEARR